MMEEKGYCSKCGAEIMPFSRKYSVAAQDYFCVKCAEQLDREYLARTSCAICGKRLKPGELKFVMPSKAFGDDKLHPIERVACLECHKKLADEAPPPEEAKRKEMHLALLAAIRSGIVKRMYSAPKKKPDEEKEK